MQKKKKEKLQKTSITPGIKCTNGDKLNGELSLVQD